ncbi:MAG: hypothetical protein JHD28_07730 [Bacteroidia bacterium]|nr:hypothetical protein [Bacteroidia bacterium]
MQPKSPVKLLSKHLFWDTEITKIDIQKNKSFIIQRVLEFGLWSDWEIITNCYGVKEIGLISTQFRTLDLKALAFIINITGLSIEDFRCYAVKNILNS